MPEIPKNYRALENSHRPPRAGARLIDVAGSAAPGAKIAVYFAPWSEQGRVDAVMTAMHDNVNKPLITFYKLGLA